MTQFKRMLFAVNICLLAAIAFVILLPSSNDGEGARSGNKQFLQNDEPLSPASDSVDYGALERSDLFGTVARARRLESRTIPQPPRVESAEPLNLSLLGTIAGDSSLARAIIKPEGQQRQGVYRKGDRVMGAEIVEIGRKRVILHRDGTNYELTMDMIKTVELEEKAENDDNDVLAAANFADAVRTTAGGVIEVDRDQVLEKGGGMFSLIRHVQENLQAEPYRVEGQTIGLKLMGVNDIGAAKLAGIQEGDVVRSVNGEVISSVHQAMLVFRRTRHLDDVNVQVQRNGENVELRYRFR